MKCENKKKISAAYRTNMFPKIMTEISLSVNYCVEKSTLIPKKTLFKYLKKYYKDNLMYNFIPVIEKSKLVLFLFTSLF